LGPTKPRIGVRVLPDTCEKGVSTTQARSSRVLVLGALVLVTISALVVANATLGHRETSGGPTHPERGTPCGGSEISLAGARGAATFQLIEPQAPLANPNNLESVWTCTSVAGGIGLVYDSGAAVLESVKGLSESYDESSVGDVEGVPASFADPAVNDAVGGVDLVVGDVRYTVSGNGKIPLEDLIAVARSLMIQVT
jgi:hypothetical protein